MFVETIVPREDVIALLESALPLAVHFEGGGSLELFGLSEVTLVPERGLQVTCKAKVLWPALGIPLRVALRSLTLMLQPVVTRFETGEVLELELSIERADFAGIPDFADAAIRRKIDAALRAKKHAMAFDFTHVLRHRLVLPKNVEPISTVSIEAAWAKLRITEEALVVVVSVHTTLARGALAPWPTTALARRPVQQALARATPYAGALLTVGAAFLFGAMLATVIARRA
jgi:hypothetical protein